MRIDPDLKFDFDDVLLRPKRSTLFSRKDVVLVRKYKFKNSGKEFIGIPIIAANMDGVGTVEMAKTLRKEGMLTCLVKSYTEEELKHHLTGLAVQSDSPIPPIVSIGISYNDFLKVKELHDYLGPILQYVCVDVANGYSETFINFISDLRKMCPEVTIIAGNVCTPEQTEQLLLSGADIVKVGIGPGACCTTRIQTGVGYPQLSAIIECADAAHGLGGHIIGDGGCRNPGDVVKAFAAGADFVMLGSMLAGHDEGTKDILVEERAYLSGELDTRTGEEIVDNKLVVRFYGMSSSEANNKHNGGLQDYRSSEGRVVEVPYKGPVKDTVQNILGGIRSACTYVGARTLKDLSKCTTFIRCNRTHNDVYSSRTVGY